MYLKRLGMQRIFWKNVKKPPNHNHPRIRLDYAEIFNFVTKAEKYLVFCETKKLGPSHSEISRCSTFHAIDGKDTNICNFKKLTLSTNDKQNVLHVLVLLSLLVRQKNQLQYFLSISSWQNSSNPWKLEKRAWWHNFPS